MSRVEQITDEVYVLSDVEPASGDRSWLPADAKGFEPFNKYVIVKPDVVFLLDTGVAAHCDSIIASLRDIVGDGKLIMLPTRSNLEAIGNMGPIIDAFPRVQLLTTTRALPPLGLCHIRDDKRDSVAARGIRRGEASAELVSVTCRPQSGHPDPRHDLALRSRSENLVRIRFLFRGSVGHGLPVSRPP